MTEAITATPGTRVVNGRQVPEAGTWAIDPSHASFEFVARHLMAKVRGNFSGVSGVATIAEIPEESTLEVEIDASTIDTKDPNRDAHLRSNDFFGVEDHPTISFRSTAVRSGEGENEWQVDGDLTIKGVTRPVTVDVEFLGAGIDPWATSGSASRAWSPWSTGRTGAWSGTPPWSRAGSCWPSRSDWRSRPSWSRSNQHLRDIGRRRGLSARGTGRRLGHARGTGRGSRGGGRRYPADRRSAGALRRVPRRG